MRKQHVISDNPGYLGNSQVISLMRRSIGRLFVPGDTVIEIGKYPGT